MTWQKVPGAPPHEDWRRISPRVEFTAEYADYSGRHDDRTALRNIAFSDHLATGCLPRS
jgi:hypothetical protein